MEWVETVGRTVDLAKELALDHLGVDHDDAEFVVVDEGSTRFFGLITRPARVRARVRPTRPRPKMDRRDRRRRAKEETSRSAESATAPATSGDSAVTHTAEPTPPSPARPKRSRGARSAASAPGGTPAMAASGSTATMDDADNGTGTSSDPPPTDDLSQLAPAEPVAEAPPSQLATASSGETHDVHDEGDDEMHQHPPADEELESGTAFLNGLLEAFGLEGTVTTQMEETGATLDVRGPDLGLLIGPRGATLAAVQDLTRAVAQRGPGSGRLSVDVSGYREKRTEALRRFAIDQAGQVVATGEARRLEPMNAVDRKVVHDAVADVDGVASSSEGEDPQRRVVIRPA